LRVSENVGQDCSSASDWYDQILEFSFFLRLKGVPVFGLEPIGNVPTQAPWKPIRFIQLACSLLSHFIGIWN
jgi:hypothetical protein